MAKNEYALARAKDEPTVLVLEDGTPWAAPSLGEFLAMPADATGTGKIGESSGGLEIINVSRAFKLIDAKTHDGSPVIVTMNVSFKRNAMTAQEQERVDRAVEKQDAKSTASKLRKAEESQKNISIAVELQERAADKRVEDVRANAASNKPVDPATAIADAFRLVNVIQSVLPKALPAGETK